MVLLDYVCFRLSSFMRQTRTYVRQCAGLTVLVCIVVSVTDLFSILSSLWNLSHITDKSHHSLFQCVGAQADETEDLFCLNRAEFFPTYKNPCWRDDGGTIHCLPYFHLLGVDKCGTTDLYGRIAMHPDVELCTCLNGKETWFWSWGRYGFHHKAYDYKNASTFSRYVMLFDKAARQIQGQRIGSYHHRVVGDGTPMDFWDMRGWTTIPQNRGLQEPIVLTPRLMRHVYHQSIKFIVILRNPVDRLYSDYIFLKYGNSSTSFHLAVVKSIRIMNDCFHAMSRRTCMFSHKLYTELPTRLHIGCYAVFLKEWLKVFPRNSFLILRTEDYQQNIKATLSSVFKFLNLSQISPRMLKNIAELQRLYVTTWKKNAGDMLPTTRTLLEQFYSEYNSELTDLLHDRRYLWRS